MRRTSFLIVIAVVAVLLAACSGGGGVTITIPDRVDRTVDAAVTSGDPLAEQPTTVAMNVALEPGEERVYRVRIPDDASRPALYVYLDTDLPLYVYDSLGRTHATSRSNAFFASGTSGLSAATSSETFAPQVAVAEECPGSCVILPSDRFDPLYVRVYNPGDSTRTFTLWAVLRDFADEGEGDTLPIAPTETGTMTESGAIETLGDVDRFSVVQQGLLYFDYAAEGTTGMDLVAEVVPSGGGDSFTLEPNDEEGFPVVPGDEVRVFSRNDRAAASANSMYFLEVVPQ